MNDSRPLDTSPLPDALPSPIRILHIEDEPNDVAIIHTTLNRQGLVCDIVAVRSREEFLKALDGGGFHVILSDFSLPSFDGATALRLANERCPEIPFIVVSGTLGEESAVELLVGGASDYVLKDRISRLGVAIRRCLKDAEQQKKALTMQETLLRQEAFYRSLIDHSFDLILLLGENGVIQYASSSVLVILGYHPEEMVDQNIFDFMHPEDLKRATEGFRGVVNTPGTPIDIEVRLKHRGQSWRHIQSRGQVMRREGEVPTVVVNARDVTDQRLLEAQYYQAQKMEAIGRLSGGIAHDFNNVITAIMGYSQLMLDSLPPDHTLRSDLEEVRKAGERAAALTAQLLSMSRKQSIRPTLLEVNEVVANVEKMLRRVIGEDVELIQALHASSVMLRADRGQLEQILLNLVVNARDAMPKGGQVTLQTSDVNVTMSKTVSGMELKPGRYVVLAVSDTGTGIPPEVVQHLYEPFFTTKEQGKGTGLGLATVYGIVQQNGGVIEVETQLGTGTTFRMYFPMVGEGVASVSGARIEAAKPLRATETVLLVEDETPVRTLLHHVLDKEGYAVITASNGEEALGVSRKFEGVIHVLVTDEVMPGMTGTELAETLKKLRPSMKVLRLSGYPDPGPDTLLKPFLPQVLVKKIREILNG